MLDSKLLPNSPMTKSNEKSCIVSVTLILLYRFLKKRKYILHIIEFMKVEVGVNANVEEFGLIDSWQACRYLSLEDKKI